MTYKILGNPLSPFTRKVALFAAEMGLNTDLTLVNPYAPPDGFETISPLKRVPVLQANGFTLNDSSAICAYLNAAHPAHTALFPTEPEHLGHALWIEEYADTALFSEISTGVFRPIFINEMRGLPIDTETVKASVAEHLPPLLTYLETQISGKDWFCGGAISIADVSVYSQMANLLHSKCLPDGNRFPYLMKHFERISSRLAAVGLYEAELLYLEQVRASLRSSA
ncbi:glutathione S-transferase [Sulfitobacter marinus]|uniref:Glutathione S-transferase n=1 Tax=Sulfitobacter marinus TaxID=394264 RepID=A0A1I6QZI7_9RHOB|nr:glutathione S-transferase family protein [Sulfitobacter marinus]SFS57901.1 glutathione S-transferase [Sulfitobacter marinus]